MLPRHTILKAIYEHYECNHTDGQRCSTEPSILFDRGNMVRRIGAGTCFKTVVRKTRKRPICTCQLFENYSNTWQESDSFQIILNIHYSVRLPNRIQVYSVFEDFEYSHTHTQDFSPYCALAVPCLEMYRLQTLISSFGPSSKSKANFLQPLSKHTNYTFSVRMDKQFHCQKLLHALFI